MMRDLAHNMAALFGMAAIVYGVYVLNAACGFIVAGLFALLTAEIGALGKWRRGDDT